MRQQIVWSSTFCWCCKTESVYFFIWHPFYAPKPLSSLFTYSKAWSTPMAVNLSSVLSHVQFVFKKSQVSQSDSFSSYKWVRWTGVIRAQFWRSKQKIYFTKLSCEARCKLHNFCQIALMYSKNYQSWKPHLTSILLTSSNWRGNCWSFQKI